MTESRRRNTRYSRRRLRNVLEQVRHREAVLTDYEGDATRVLEEAARWGQQGAELAQWTLNNDDIFMLTIPHALFKTICAFAFAFGLL